LGIGICVTIDGQTGFLVMVAGKGLQTNAGDICRNGNMRALMLREGIISYTLQTASQNYTGDIIGGAGKSLLSNA